MALPWYAIVILGLATLVSAFVWVTGARMRVRRNEPMLPSFATMAARGALAPVAMLLMAADFATSLTTWGVWIALVVGSWVITLGIVRAALRATFGEPAASLRENVAERRSPAAVSQAPEAEAAQA